MMRLILATALVVFSMTNLLAQNQLNNFNYSLVTSDKGVNSVGDTVYIISADVNVSDSLNISAVEVIMGTFLGGEDLVKHTFSVGQNYGLPNNYTITKSWNKITVGLGYHQPGIYYYKIRLHNLSGQYSDYLIYNPTDNSFQFN